MPSATDLGTIAFSPGGEEWLEYGPDDDRRRLAFHDYAAIYDVPGLYERVFHQELGMRSAEVLVELYADVLEELGRAPEAERVLDLGAGSGLGGELLRAEGVGRVVGLDLEPAARRATHRDRPGAYDEYLVADLSASPESLARLRDEKLTALLAISAIGAGHIPLALLADTITELLPPGGLFGFAVADELLPAFLDEFFARVPAQRLRAQDYVHRRQADGSPHAATAVLARLA